MTADLRSVLTGIDKSIEDLQGLIRQMMRMRRFVAEAADHADIDARYDAADVAQADLLAEDLKLTDADADKLRTVA